MSAPAFTPGPWWLDHDDESHEHEWELMGRGEQRVCELQHFSRKSTAEANARLIASAPELYEALAYIREQNPDPVPIGRRHWIRRVDAALAKARGEQ